VISIETESSEAIIPAAVRKAPKTISLLGEELFDYREVLSIGDGQALRKAWQELAKLGLPFEAKALRGEPNEHWRGFSITDFSGAPFVRHDASRHDHPRSRFRLNEILSRGCRLQSRQCELADVGTMYRLKAAQDSRCLFLDPLRIEMVEQMVAAYPKRWGLLTLTDGEELVAAGLSFQDKEWRRFYGTYYDHRWAKFSPGIALANRLVENTMQEQMHLDLMTGEQPYKLRLAEATVPLFRVSASAVQLAEVGSETTSSLRAA
jgi:hypothetical protein